MKFLASQTILLAALLMFVLPHSACADIYWFTDENGVTHFSNVPTDKRYVPFMADGSAGRASGPKPGPSPVPRQKEKYSSLIEEIARIYALESALIHAVVSVESAYDATAVSRKGAAGLMQLMPETARRYGVIDRFDPKQNLHGGARYLSDLLRMFNGDLNLSLAAYNSGENNVIKHGNRIPPFPETRHYVPRVLDYYRKYQAARKLGT